MSKEQRQDNLSEELPQLKREGLPASNNHHNSWWWRAGDTHAGDPAGAAEKGGNGTPPAGQEEGKQHEPSGRMLANMAEALKCHALGAHELAGSKPNGIYVEAEQRAAPQRHPATWHCLVVSKGSLTYEHRKQYWQLRAGQLPTQTNLFKWGKTKSKACPLCGAPEETQGHVLLACKALERAKTERHHRAGRIILAAVGAGAKGGEIKCADLGSAATCAEERGHQPLPNIWGGWAPFKTRG